jgi:Ca2+-binding EF-hand superfamily protein
MKSISLFSAFVAATLFISAQARAADSANPPAPASAPEGSSARSAREAELLKRYDKNGDGKIDEEEKAAAKLDMLKAGDEGAGGPNGGKLREQILKRFDKNHDGKLDEEERAQALEALQKNPRFIKRFDKNNDGKLDEAELAAARAELAQRWADRREAKKSP